MTGHLTPEQVREINDDFIKKVLKSKPNKIKKEKLTFAQCYDRLAKWEQLFRYTDSTANSAHDFKEIKDIIARYKKQLLSNRTLHECK